MILYAIFMAGSLLAGVLAGRLLAGQRDPSRLSRREREELRSLRFLTSELSVRAAEHSMLGDNFAVIVASEINAHNSTIHKRSN